MNAGVRPYLPLALRLRILLALLLSLLPLLWQLPATLSAWLAGGWLAVALLGWRKPPAALLRLLLTLLMLASVIQVMGIRPGRDTGCALLAAMLAIKGSELQQPRDAASALGFALFAPFAAFLLDQGPTTLALGLLAVVAVLACQTWRTQSPPGTAASVDLAVLRRTGALLLLGLPLALAAFWLLPRLHSPLWGLPERALGRPGLSDTMAPGQWLDLMVDDSAAFRVQFDGPVPEARQRYWRGPVLSDFDGQAWRRARSGPVSLLSAPQPSTAPAQWRYRIDYEPTDKRELVALDLPLAAPEDSWQDAEGALYSPRPLNRLTRWELASSPPVPQAAPLTPAQRHYYLQLPPGFNPRTVALGRQWRQEAAGEDVRIVQRALDWIESRFQYTLSTPLPGRHLADEFLFDQQAGFCEHFSSAFAILMRSAGIPTRVVTGYAGGVRNRYGDYWVVRRLDAHAWNEVWLEGRGWVRVDPTAAVAPERILDTLEDRLAAGGARNDGLLPTLADRWQALREAGDWMRQRWNQQILGYDAAAQARLMARLRLGGLPTTRALIVLWTGLSLVLLGLLWWWLQRRPASRDPLLRAWQRLGRRYQPLGLAPLPAETAHAWAARVHATRGHADELRELARRYNQQRYAGQADPGLLDALRRHRPARI